MRRMIAFGSIGVIALSMVFAGAAHAAGGTWVYMGPTGAKFYNGCKQNNGLISKFKVYNTKGAALADVGKAC